MSNSFLRHQIHTGNARCNSCNLFFQYNWMKVFLANQMFRCLHSPGSNVRPVANTGAQSLYKVSMKVSISSIYKRKPGHGIRHKPTVRHQRITTNTTRVLLTIYYGLFDLTYRANPVQPDQTSLSKQSCFKTARDRV